jgi:hypothetical protein
MSDGKTAVCTICKLSTDFCVCEHLSSSGSSLSKYIESFAKEVNVVSICEQCEQLKQENEILKNMYINLMISQIPAGSPLSVKARRENAERAFNSIYKDHMQTAITDHKQGESEKKDCPTCKGNGSYTMGIHKMSLLCDTCGGTGKTNTESDKITECKG